MNVAVRVPDHLGDAVMSLPALRQLATCTTLTLHSDARWAHELFPGFNLQSAAPPTRADAALLFKPSWHAAWAWRHLPTWGVGPPGVYRNALPERTEHRRDRYIRIASDMLQTSPKFKTQPPRARSHGYIGLNPLSPSKTVVWPGFYALAEALSGEHELVGFCGPGESAAAQAMLPRDTRWAAGASLPEFAATLADCRLFISNDSGAAHFAAEHAVPVLMIHGSTAPERTGVGTAAERDARLWCQPCYRKTCLWGRPCLDVPVSAVLDKVRTILGQGAPPPVTPPAP